MSKKTTTNKTAQGATTLAIAVDVESAPQMLELLQKELSSLQAVSQTPFKTVGNLEGFGDIKSEKSIPKLISAMASVLVREKYYNEAADDLLQSSLKGTYPPYSVSGGLVKDWAHDINLRIEVLAYAERKAELEQLVDEGKKFLTEKDQFQMYLNKVAKKFGQA